MADLSARLARASGASSSVRMDLSYFSVSRESKQCNIEMSIT